MHFLFLLLGLVGLVVAEYPIIPTSKQKPTIDNPTFTNTRTIAPGTFLGNFFVPSSYKLGFTIRFNTLSSGYVIGFVSNGMPGLGLKLEGYGAFRIEIPIQGGTIQTIMSATTYTVGTNFNILLEVGNGQVKLNNEQFYLIGSPLIGNGDLMVSPSGFPAANAIISNIGLINTESGSPTSGSGSTTTTSVSTSSGSTTGSSNLPIIIGAGVGGVCVLVALGLVVRYRRIANSKKKKLQEVELEQESSKDKERIASASKKNEKKAKKKETVQPPIVAQAPLVVAQAPVQEHVVEIPNQQFSYGYSANVNVL